MIHLGRMGPYLIRSGVRHVNTYGSIQQRARPLHRTSVRSKDDSQSSAEVGMNAYFASTPQNIISQILRSTLLSNHASNNRRT